MKIISIVFFLLLLSCQKQKPYPQVSQSTNQVVIERLYNDLSTISEESSDSILQYANNMEYLARNEPKEYRSMALFLKGVSYANNASYLLSNKNLEAALQLLHNSKADTLNAKIYIGFASNFVNTGNYQKALDNIYKALTIYERHGNKIGVCNAYTILGEINFQKGNVALSKENIKTALRVLEKDKFSLYYLSAAHSLANIYGISGDFKSAIAIDEECIRISDRISSAKMKVAFLDNKANCFLYSNQLDSAQIYFEKCIHIDLKIGNRKQIADSYSNLGQLYFVKKDFPKAERLTLKSIKILKSINGKSNLDKGYTSLVSIYGKQRNFEKAFYAQNLLLQNYKSMIDEKEANSAAEFKTLHETQKKESRIQSLVRERSIRELIIIGQASEIMKRNYFIGGFVLLFTTLLFLVFMWRKKQSLQNLLAREKIIRETEELERVRFAKDIHDDLGSGLSKINFLSEIISKKTAHMPEVKGNSEAVKEAASKMIENMRDLIWALNPDNATLVDLVSRMREYTTDYLEDYPIKISYKIPDVLPQIMIRKECYREIFMVVKETLNNITKYAQATKVNFAVALTGSDLILCIRDNGIGFNDALISKGNGLLNMKSRLEGLGGICAISSKNEKGTTIMVEISLQKINKIN